MLYVTTREKYDAFTPIRTLQADAGHDGGRYFPYKMPCFTPEELACLKEKSFGQNVADVINGFLGCNLTAWDVEFVIGRYPVKIQSVSQKILIAELWRNLEGSYDKLEKQLASRICREFPGETNLTSWLRIAIGVAVLTGVFGELQRQGTVDAVDVAVDEGDFVPVMTVWYAKVMGLPIATIICGCKDGSAAWELIHNGSVRDCASMPELERLVRGTLGVDEARSFAAAATNKEAYQLQKPMHTQLSSGICAAVVSQERINTAIPNVQSTAGYKMEPQVAAAYSALLDYRAKTGERRTALLLGGNNPAGAKERRN